MSQRKSDQSQENRHPAVTPEDCEIMGRLNGWKLKKVRKLKDPGMGLNVMCFFFGPQTNFSELDPYADND